MEKYTTEEIEEIAEVLNKVGPMDWDEYILCLVDEIYKYCRSDEINERVQNIDLGDDETRDKLEIDIYDRIMELVSEENMVSFLEKLNYDTIQIFLDDKVINNHPEIIAITLRKLSEKSGMLPNELENNIDYLIEKLDDDYIDEHFEQILQNAEKYFKIEKNLDINLFRNFTRKTDDMFNQIPNKEVLSIAIQKLLERVPEEKRKDYTKSAIDSILETEDIAEDVSKHISKIISRGKIREDDIEEYVLAALNHKIKFEDDYRLIISGTVGILSSVPSRLQEKGIDTILKNLSTFPNSEEKIDNPEDKRAKLLFEIMEVVYEHVLKEKLPDFMKAIQENTTEKNEKIIKENLAEFYELIGDESLLLNIPGSKMSKVLLSLKYGNKKKVADYMKCVLKNDPHALTNNDLVAGVYQGLENDSKEAFFVIISENDKDELRKIFADYMPKTSEPDMSKYDEYLEKLTDMDEETFKMFMIDLKNYRNVHGNFSEKCCDYLISQKIKSSSLLNQNLDEYFPVFKRAFEDKTKYVLKEQGIEKYVVRITDNGWSGLDQIGVHSNRAIRISESMLEKMDENFTHPINTIFHETRHAVQKKDLDENEITTGLKYRLMKEKILEKEFPKFYEDNYFYMLSEVDARIYGNKRQRQYLVQLGYTENIKNDDDKDFFEIYRGLQKKEIDRLDITEWARKDSEGKFRAFNNIFSKLIKSKPELLAEYPILALEYETDGSRRTSFEILKDYDEAIRQVKDKNPETKSKIAILSSILGDYAIINESIILKDIDLLVDYEPVCKTSLKFRDTIIREQILNYINICGRKGKINLGKNSSEEEKKDGFEQAVSKLNKFTQKNPDDPISKEIKGKIEGFLAKIEQEKMRKIDKEVTSQDRAEGKNMVAGMKIVKPNHEADKDEQSIGEI